MTDPSLDGVIPKSEALIALNHSRNIRVIAKNRPGIVIERELVSGVSTPQYSTWIRSKRLALARPARMLPIHAPNFGAGGVILFLLSAIASAISFLLIFINYLTVCSYRQDHRLILRFQYIEDRWSSFIHRKGRSSQYMMRSLVSIHHG